MQEKFSGTGGRTEAAVRRMGVTSGRGFAVFTVILAVRSPSASTMIGIIVVSRMRMDGNIIIVVISITPTSTKLEKDNLSLSTYLEQTQLEAETPSTLVQGTVIVDGRDLMSK